MRLRISMVARILFDIKTKATSLYTKIKFLELVKSASLTLYNT